MELLNDGQSSGSSLFPHPAFVVCRKAEEEKERKRKSAFSSVGAEFTALSVKCKKQGAPLLKRRNCASRRLHTELGYVLSTER